MLAIEDEPLILLLLKDMVDALGGTVVSEARLLSEALDKARTVEVDAAILDLNLGGSKAYPVADALIERNIPFVFASGFGVGGIDAAYRRFPVVEKPYQLDDLENGLVRALEGTPVG